MNLIDVICNGAMAATANIISGKGLTVDLDKVTGALKSETLKAYDQIVAEMKEANDCRMHESVLSAILNVGCTQIAIESLKACGVQF